MLLLEQHVREFEYCERSALGLLKPSKIDSPTISPLILGPTNQRDSMLGPPANGSELPLNA